jgi:hypothetical protein
MSDTPINHTGIYVVIDLSNMALAVDFLDQHCRSVCSPATYPYNPDG